MRKTQKATKLSREQLDKKLQTIAKSGIFTPAKGWIHAIREALGMSQSQLAERLKITRQSLHRIENSENSGGLELKTLMKVADALDCEVGYVLLPRKGLENTVRGQALKLAKRIVAETEKHMRLERQGTGSDFQGKAVVDLTEELIREGGKKIWSINDQEN
jgi:predicted DNA-binding mobile mystery protein A